MLNHFSRVRLFATQWSIARQAPLSMGFSRQEYWSGLPCPPPGDPPDLWMEPMSLRSPALAGRFFTSSVTWEALYNDTWEKKNHLFFWIKRNLCLFPLSEAGESPVLSLMLGDKNPLPFRESKGHNSETARCSCLRCAVGAAWEVVSLHVSISPAVLSSRRLVFCSLPFSGSLTEALLLLACTSAHPFSSPSLRETLA